MSKAFGIFASVDLDVAEDVIVENVNLSESLLTLSYLLNEKELLGDQGD